MTNGSVQIYSLTFLMDGDLVTKCKTWLVIVCLLLTSPTFLFSQDLESQTESNWHQWRGPSASGVSNTANPPLSWGEEKNVRWKTAIPGEGSSTPIIWGDNLFVLSAVDTGRMPDVAAVVDPQSLTKPPETIIEFTVWCLDCSTGKIKWEKIVNQTAPHEGRHPSTTYAAASPTTDGKHLFVSFGSYGVYCLTLDGEIVWNRDFGTMRTRRGWGEAVSPVVYNDRLIINWDQEDQSKIHVLDSSNGKTLWEKDRNEPTTWATPLVVPYDGKTQVITNGTHRIRSYDLESGQIVWQSTGTTLNAIPCPVLGGSDVFCMAGYRGNAAYSISLDSTGEIPQEKLNWQFNKETPYVPSPLVIDGRLYFTKSNQAILSCLDVETGKPVYERKRLPRLKNMYASPVANSDRIYFVSREGVTLIIENSPEFKVLATNKISEGIDASPALVGNRLFLRSKSSVYCIEGSD